MNKYLFASCLVNEKKLLRFYIAKESVLFFKVEVICYFLFTKEEEEKKTFLGPHPGQ